MTDLERRQQQSIHQAYALMCNSVQVMRHNHQLAMVAAQAARDLLQLLEDPPGTDTVDGNPPRQP